MAVLLLMGCSCHAFSVDRCYFIIIKHTQKEAHLQQEQRKYVISGTLTIICRCQRGAVNTRETPGTFRRGGMFEIGFPSALNNVFFQTEIRAETDLKHIFQSSWTLTIPEFTFSS